MSGKRVLLLHCQSSSPPVLLTCSADLLLVSQVLTVACLSSAMEIIATVETIWMLGVCAPKVLLVEEQVVALVVQAVVDCRAHKSGHCSTSNHRSFAVGHTTDLLHLLVMPVHCRLQ